MFSRISILISSLVISTAFVACTSAEKRNEEQQARAAAEEKAQQEAAAKAQRDAEAQLFKQMKPEELRSLVQEGVVYGYPLVMMDANKELHTNPESPLWTRGEINKFSHSRKRPVPGAGDAPLSDADTLLSTAWVDLSKEPVVFSVPSVGNQRFYLIEVVDAWANVIATVGTRATGTGSGDFALVGPRWEGQLPANVRRIQSPTEMVYLQGRTYTSGGKDLEVANVIQNRYQLQSLSQFERYILSDSNQDVALVDSAIQWRSDAREMVEAMDAPAFFTKLSRLMVSNPPLPQDKAMLAKLEKIGVRPGQTVDYGQLPAEVVRSLNEAIRGGYQRVEDLAKNVPGRMMNGWVVHEVAESSGVDYERRAGMAWRGQVAHLSQDAIFPMAHVDATGSRLTGANKYTLRFAKGNLPPVNGFWSISVYDSKQGLVSNSIKRYSLNSRDKLKKSKDGSLSLLLQAANPGKGKTANWLPTPRGEFTAVMRLYWPKQAALNGEWRIPGIEKGRSPTRLTQRTAKRISKR